MTRRDWTVDGLAFRILMEQAGRDRLPFPIQYQPTADSVADYHRQRHEASSIVNSVMDDDLRVAMHTVVMPQVRVEVVGHSGSAKLRGHAAIGHDVAVVLTQPPGNADRSGGPVTMTLVEPFHAVSAVLEVLPRVGIGTTPRFDAEHPVAPDADNQASPLLRLHSGRTRSERLEAFVARPRTSAGEILVCTGPSTDNRFEDGTTGVQWADLADDGRYMIRHGSVVTVLPASATDILAEVRGLVGEALART